MLNDRSGAHAAERPHSRFGCATHSFFASQALNLRVEAWPNSASLSSTSVETALRRPKTPRTRSKATQHLSNILRRLPNQSKVRRKRPECGRKFGRHGPQIKPTLGDSTPYLTEVTNMLVDVAQTRSKQWRIWSNRVRIWSTTPKERCARHWNAAPWSDLVDNRPKLHSFT